jgi:hypothetical protein
MYHPVYDCLNHSATLPQRISFLMPLDPELEMFSIKQLKQAIANEVKCGAQELVLRDVVSGRVFAIGASCGESDLARVHAWRLPGSNDKDNLVVQVMFYYMLDPSQYSRVASSPTLIVLPKHKCHAFPVAELRQIIRRSVSPFLKGGWKQDEVDSDLYLVDIMNQPQTESLGPVDLTCNYPADLLAFEPTFGLGVFFKSETLYLDRHVALL